ncbi:MAG: SUMF1/EgtB/PvdO family nonheme iron enzyme [Muribaculaceae bacterium]|nr:SUMF1/EgtB/PvdO family nonheme iron enzyme [Muribaculaceae bacterium]
MMEIMQYNHRIAATVLTVLMALSLSFHTSAGNGNRGDVNSDGSVTIGDVSSLIDYLLSGDESGISLTAADVNHDNSVTIGDVSSLIDYLLSGEWPEEPVQTFTVNGVDFVMVPVEGGTFSMGATAEQGSDASSRERPVHQVTLSSYAIGQTEVTQELWLAVMGSNPSHFNGNQLPVEMVSWEDCQTFIAMLNELTDQHFRLPTEAEWEYAARGGNYSQGYKYAGGNNLAMVGWYSYNDSWELRGTGYYGTHAVSTREPNELQLYDMSGNVHEWCQDRYGDYTSAAQVDPTGPSTGTTRVYRGGNWYFDDWFCRVSFRNGLSPTTSNYGIGLRLAL